MTIPREVGQMALDALEILAKYENPLTKIQVRKPLSGGPIVTIYPHKVAADAAEALRTALAANEPEPVAYDVSGATVYIKPPIHNGKYLTGYTAPPQRDFIGLTDEDLSVCDEDGVILARYWEAKLREKNNAI